MTRTFVSAALLAALVSTPLAAQTSPPAGSTTPSSRYKLQGPTKVPSQPATKSPTQPASGQRQVLGPAAPPRRATTDGSVRPAGDTQPIREPGPGKTPPRQPLGPNIKGQPPVDAPPKPPSWFPLDAEQQKWVDDVLAEWEQTGMQVQYFECAVERWEFEPVFGPRDGKTPKVYAKGVLKYQFPDKGLFRDDVVKWYVAPAAPDEQPTYEVPKDKEGKELKDLGEHWVCDGTSIFQFDAPRKRVVQQILPKEMQGQAIVNGPLPFVFGAKAAEIRQRYWIRPLEPPKGVTTEYWLEAWPKHRQDAAEFKMVHVVIAQKDFMPSKLSVYEPNYDPKRHPARKDYKFENRKARMKDDRTISAQDLMFWKSQFYQPKVPYGWKKEVLSQNGPSVANGAKVAPAAQAQRIKTGAKTK